MKATKKIEYQWIIVVISFLMIMVSMGFCTTTKGLYVAPITEALGIKRSAYSLHTSFHYVTTFIINLFFGTLISRYGIKKLVIAGQVALIISNLIFIVSITPMGFCLGGIFMGIGSAWTATSMIGTIVNRWCKAHKGTIMGLIFSANGFGGAIGTMLLTPIIHQEGNPFGYRNAYLLTITFLIAIGIVLLLFFKEKPDNAMLEPAQEKKTAKTQWEGISFQVLKGKWFLYGAAACALIVGMVMQGVNTVMAAHLKDVGFDADYAASVVSVYAITLAAGKFFAGIIYDRFGFRTNIFVCTITMFLALILMCIVSPTHTGKVFAMLFAIFTGIALPLETILIPVYVGELFGAKDFSKIVGIFEALTNAGFAVGIPLMNLAYDFYGSYNNAFTISAVFMVAVFIVFNLVLNSAKKLKVQDNTETTL